MVDEEGKCCCYFNLRAGVIAIACIMLIGDSIVLAWTSYVTYDLNVIIQSSRPSPWDVLVLVPFWVMVVYDVLHSLAVALDFMLLVGAITGRRRLLYAWTVGYFVVYALSVMVSVLIVVVAFLFGPSQGFSFAAGFLVHAGLVVYFWTAVGDYYQELGQESGEGQPLSSCGKVYNTMPAGGARPAQGSSCDVGGVVKDSAAPPRNTSSPTAASLP